MLEFRIDVINKKFEDLKEEVNNGKLLTFAQWEIEDLIMETEELLSLMESSEKTDDAKALLKQLNQYQHDIESLIEKDCATTL